MPKDVTKRIDDTVNFISANYYASYQIRANAGALALEFVANNFPPANAAQPAYVAVSNHMSTREIVNKGSEHQRHLRRAIILLWHAMGNLQKANIGRTLTPGELADEFRRTLLKAWCVRDRNRNRSNALQHVYTNHLLANQVEFLQHNLLQVSNLYPSPAWMLVPVAAPAVQNNVQNFYLSFDPGHDRFEISSALGVVPAGAHVFNGASVPGVNWSQVPSRVPPPPAPPLPGAPPGPPGAAQPATFANIRCAPGRRRRHGIHSVYRLLFLSEANRGADVRGPYYARQQRVSTCYTGWRQWASTGTVGCRWRSCGRR